MKRSFLGGCLCTCTIVLYLFLCANYNRLICIILSVYDLQARLQPLLQEDHEDAAEAEEEEARQTEAEDQGEDGEAA